MMLTKLKTVATVFSCCPAWPVSWTMTYGHRRSGRRESGPPLKDNANFTIKARKSSDCGRS